MGETVLIAINFSELKSKEMLQLVRIIVQNLEFFGEEIHFCL